MSLNSDHLATSAENWNGGREATSGLNDSAARKDCARTRVRREPIAHLTKASSRRCLVVQSHPRKLRDSGISKQEYLVSTYAGRHGRLLPERMTPRKASDKPSWPGHKETEHARTGVIYRRNAELLQSLKRPQQKS